MGSGLIKLENVTKIFYTDEVETHALSGIHLDINKGEYVYIAGPSGCGKSTLLSIIGLLDSPTDGSYVLNNRPVQGLDFSDRARIRNQEIGFIFQSFNLIGDGSGGQHALIPPGGIIGDREPAIRVFQRSATTRPASGEGRLCWSCR